MEQSLYDRFFDWLVDLIAQRGATAIARGAATRAARAAARRGGQLLRSHRSQAVSRFFFLFDAQNAQDDARIARGAAGEARL